MAKSISQQEKEWRAREDANTLARYQEIMNDASRKKAAIAAAQKEASSLEKRASALKLASGGKLKK